MMKTNANPKTIIQAVENVSKRLYGGNVVFRKTPEKMTKNVSRFTVKTLDANKPGSLVTKDGVKQTKAQWEVHQNILTEILNLDPRSHIFVDTVYGRQHGKSTPMPVAKEEPVEVVETTKETAAIVHGKTRGRKPKAQKSVTIDNNQNVTNLIHAIKYIMQHPNILNE